MILLTGTTGYVASYLAPELVRRGHQLRYLVRRASETRLPAPGEVSHGDVTDPEAARRATAGIDTVIHLAAIIQEKGRATFQRVNYEGARNLIHAAKEAGVRKFIFMSNIGVSPDPSLSFLYSKWLGEEELKNSGLPYIILRSSVLFGRGDRFVLTLADLIRRLPIVPIIGNGRAKFQLISAQEVARCIAQAAEDDNLLGQTLYLAGPEHLSYEDLIDLIIHALGKKRLKLHIPLPLMRPGVWLMEKVLPQPPVTLRQLDMLRLDNITELDAVEKAFGFKPTSLRQAIGYINERA